jgi:hypothetical protein
MWKQHRTRSKGGEFGDLRCMRNYQLLDKKKRLYSIELLIVEEDINL